MQVYFDIVKAVFFFLTVLIMLYELKLKWILSSDLVGSIWPYVLPAYFVFLWLIIWYVIWYIVNLSKDNKNEEKNYTIWFIVGIIIWVLFAFIYYSFINA